MIRPVVVLPVSRPDYHLAVKLIRWMRILEKLRDGEVNGKIGRCDYHLIVLMAASIESAHQEEMEKELAEWETARMYVNPERYEHPELGYAAMANHAFKAGLEAVEKLFPAAPMLWMEADCVPIRPSWHQEISLEYEKCGKFYMGDFHPYGAKPHMTGNGVYGADWRERCPSFALLPGPNPREGWDSSCRGDTLPQSHRSCTIQQVWEPPRFTEEKMGMIHPETALFHRSKDGSLIDVLTKRADFPRIPSRAPIAPPSPRTAQFRIPQPIIAGARVEIFIVTYKKDMEFLRYCLRSIAMYAAGFSGVTLVVPHSEKHLYDWIPKGVRLVLHEEHAGKGNMDHCIMKCRADEICPTADMILYFDADCIAWKGFSPDDFIVKGQPVCVRERYDEIANPNRRYWRETVMNATGLCPEYETMVRHPNIHHVSLLKRLRETVRKHTGHEFNDYVLSGQSTFPGHFCEFDSMGAIAMEEFSDCYHFIDYDRVKDAEECGQDANGSWQYIYRHERDCIVELWSHGGIDQYRKMCDQIIIGKPPEFFVK